MTTTALGYCSHRWSDLEQNRAGVFVPSAASIIANWRNNLNVSTQRVSPNRYYTLSYLPVNVWSFDIYVATEKVPNRYELLRIYFSRSHRYFYTFSTPFVLRVIHTKVQEDTESSEKRSFLYNFVYLKWNTLCISGKFKSTCCSVFKNMFLFG